MRESRLILIILLILSLLTGPIFYIMYIMKPISFDYFGIASNLYCGYIVGIITSICQFIASRTRIINSVYNAYFDLYRTYYYAKNKPFLYHYNSKNVYKKIIEYSEKTSEPLDEYYGLIKRYDKTYKKLNPEIQLNGNYKAKILSKSFYSWFNKKSFQKTYEPLMKEIEIILTGINKNRFAKDKEVMVEMLKYINE